MENTLTSNNTYWYHTKRLALMKAGHLKLWYHNVKIKKEKTNAFGWIYRVYHGRLKD
jgi:hypothetical protein